MEKVLVFIAYLFAAIFIITMVFAQLEIFSISTDVKKIKKILERKEVS